MSQVVSRIRQFSAQRTRRFWVGVGTGVLAVGAAGVALPLTAFASDAPQTVSGSASTKAGKNLTVTMTCPRGTTAVGVTGEIKGFKYATINELAPNGRKATARAFATRDVTESWSLKAKALCVHKTSDIEYVSRTETLTNPGALGYETRCPKGKELIGMGWSVDTKARVAIVMPMTTGRYGLPPNGTGTGYPSTGTGYTGTGYPGTGYPGTGYPGTGYPGTGRPGTGYPGTGYPGTGRPGTGYPGTGRPGTGYPGTGYPGTGYPGTGYPGTGYPGTGTGYSTGSGQTGDEFPDMVVIRSEVPDEDQGSAASFPAWNQTGIAVCATWGHGTYEVRATKAAPTGANQVSTACAYETRINSLGLWMEHRGQNGQLLRRLAIEPGGVMGTFDSINLDPITTDNTIEALCAVS